MENKKMTMGLFSGSIDKLTAAGVILSGVVAHDMDVAIFVLI
jgi:peroxiredoxin family protein